MKLTKKQKDFIDSLIKDNPKKICIATMTPQEYDIATNYTEDPEMEDLVDDYISEIS